MEMLSGFALALEEVVLVVWVVSDEALTEDDEEEAEADTSAELVVDRGAVVTGVA